MGSLAILAPAPAAAQADSVIVLPSDRYDAGPIERLLLGDRYRDLWSTPIRVPVLHPDTFAGGLTAERRGTSLQTLGLHFTSPTGVQYFFRSIDKEQNAGLPEDLRNTLVAYVAQDLVSSKHPGAALIIPPLLEAAGVLHATARIAVMADHPLLGEHRPLFAGMLGTIEVRPDEAEDPGSLFGDRGRIIGSERLLERIEESPADRVDARAYLAARMMDFLVGDWDRHPDQWRWAEEERDGIRYWLPIPRDRDNAFPYVDGLIGVVAQRFRHTTSRFEHRYSNLYGLLHNAQPLDRRILGELPLAVWDSIALDLRHRVSDEIIERAVRRLPREWWPLEAETLAFKLRARRDGFPELAREMYARVAHEVDLYATDEGDHAIIERFPDGSVRVRLAELDRGQRLYLERTFVPTETREVRVHLRGGADRAIMTGRGGGVTIRVLGGGGDDVLEDHSETLPGALTAFYDDRGENDFATMRRTRVDQRPYRPVVSVFPPEGNRPPPRDWGSAASPFVPRAAWPGGVGPVFGGGPQWTRFGFRRSPYAERMGAVVLYAPLDSRFGVEGEARFLRTGGGGHTRLAMSATQIVATHFYGYGNETRLLPESGLSKVWANELRLSAEVMREPLSGLRIFLEPEARFSDPEVQAFSPAAAEGVRGSEPFGVLGIRTRATIDRRDFPAYPRKGFRLVGHLGGFPLGWGDAAEAFVVGGASGFGYLPLPGPLEPTLAVRAGADRVWGAVPFQYATFVGGGSTLRGHRSQRFAGDAAVYGGSELRLRLGRANLLILAGELGAIAFTDAARVFVGGEGSGPWHSGYGGGVWFGTFDRTATLHLLYGRGETNTLHAGIGLPF